MRAVVAAVGICRIVMAADYWFHGAVGSIRRRLPIAHAVSGGGAKGRGRRASADHVCDTHWDGQRSRARSRGADASVHALRWWRWRLEVLWRRVGSICLDWRVAQQCHSRIVHHSWRVLESAGSETRSAAINYAARAARRYKMRSGIALQSDRKTAE